MATQILPFFDPDPRSLSGHLLFSHVCQLWATRCRNGSKMTPQRAGFKMTIVGRFLTCLPSGPPSGPREPSRTSQGSLFCNLLPILITFPHDCCWTFMPLMSHLLFLCLLFYLHFLRFPKDFPRYIGTPSLLPAYAGASVYTSSLGACR